MFTPDAPVPVAPITMIRLTLSEATVDNILQALVKRPFEEVWAIVSDLRTQTQLCVSTAAPREAGQTAPPPSEMEVALRRLLSHFESMQLAVRNYLIPSSTLTERDILNKLIEMLDGSTQRDVQTRVYRALKPQRRSAAPRVPGHEVAVSYAQAKNFLDLAESDRRLGVGSFDATPTGDVNDDYGCNAQLIDSGMLHLNEALPNGQAERSRTAFLALEYGVKKLRAYLEARGVL